MAISESVSLGFQNSDLGCCDIVHMDGDYRLLVRFEGNGFFAEGFVRKPSMQFEDEFLAEYSGLR